MPAIYCSLSLSLLRYPNEIRGTKHRGNALGIGAIRNCILSWKVRLLLTAATFSIWSLPGHY